jgi:group I intron endonuclease
MFVYRIFNKSNGRMYIGSTNNYMVRKNEHFGNLRNGTHHNKYLQADYNLYGLKSFVFEIIHNDIHDRTKLLLKEYDLILRYKKLCYNIHTDCPVFDPSEKQDWSMYKKRFIPNANDKAKAKKKKHHQILMLKKQVQSGKSFLKVDIPPFRRKKD